MKKIGQGATYQWRIITFAALGNHFRVLVIWNDSKQIYRATMGQERNGLIRIICIREFHANEPGWHCHAVLRCSQGVGGWTHRELRRTPQGVQIDEEFGVTSKEQATAIALRFYGVAESGALL